MSPDVEQVEHAVLAEIVSLHPAHLTPAELILRMTTEQGDFDGLAIKDAIQALKSSGLIRFTGEVVEPTYAALRAAAIFLLF